jgi:2-polyprenyl-3-methyl-5-hydroxy-6-metoxy-1,4-benzoquinol methylase
MDNFLSKIVCDPFDKSPLDFNQNDNFFYSKDSKYSLIEKAFDLRSQKHRHIETTAQLLLDFGTEFQYREHYDEDAKIHDYFNFYQCSATKDEFKRIHQSIINRVPKNSEIILDVGCGEAWVAEHFLKKGRKVISMDISETNPVKAIKTYHSENHAGLIADVFHLPIKDNSVDCIIASEIIEHVINPVEFIKELLRALKPGGKLIITTPYNEKLEYQLCVHCNKPTTKHAHLHTFDEKNINYLIPEGYNHDFLIFGNKYLGKLRTHFILGFLPFNIWRFFDKLANTLVNKPIRFLIEITK